MRQLGQVVARRDAHLPREVLDEHGEQVRRHDDPEEQVAELRAAADVRREVAGIDVRHRRDERRAEHRQDPWAHRGARRRADGFFDDRRKSFRHD
jgi:hypothetical protein